MVTYFTSNRNRDFGNKSHLVPRVERGVSWNDAGPLSLAVITECTSEFYLLCRLIG